MKIDHFDVLLDKNIDTAYIGGELVQVSSLFSLFLIQQGTIELRVSRRVLVSGLYVRVHGLVETSWRNRNSDLLYEASENILDETLPLSRFVLLQLGDTCRQLFEHCDDNFELLEGEHLIEWSFKVFLLFSRRKIQLPLDVQSSVERENFGFCRYTCTAVLELPEDGASEIVAGLFFFFN